MTSWQHPRFSRRFAIQAGSIGCMGLSAGILADLQAAAPGTAKPVRSVIYLFLSGGLGQHDSFDMKPDAPAEIRGEFNPISTRTPGVQIVEHLPLLAQRSSMWSLIRSFTHPSNDHSLGHLIMLTGRSKAPPTFNSNKPMPQDWPCIASVVGDQLESKNGLPPSVVLPERLIHRTGRVIPGQFAGEMSHRRDPWFIDACPFNSETYGAYPEYEFHHATGAAKTASLKFMAPNLSLPEQLHPARLDRRLEMLASLEDQRRSLDQAASINSFSQHRQAAVSLLTDQRVKTAFDVTQADATTQDRYGRNTFGWSCLMARRLVAAGVGLVQVNLGNNEAWDTHGNAFPNLKDYLYPPTDKAVSALLDDLAVSGELEHTLIVMAGEFGRTPKISHLPQHYKLPGRDHWGASQTVWIAGGRVAGGQVYGATDKNGAYPTGDPVSPEMLAATIYDHLGIPEDAMWHDDQNRPHAVYHAEPVRGLLS
jgi:hypothetical protein